MSKYILTYADSVGLITNGRVVSMSGIGLYMPNSMNYLAHIFLSGDDLRVAVGNFMGDGVKGRINDEYPPELRLGLYLHRYIDHVADNHPVNRLGREGLYEAFGKYAGVAQDMYHDHFLARLWGDYSAESLPVYLDRFYEMGDEYIELFPNRQARFFKGTREGRWLEHYATLDGMQRSFDGLVRRIGRPSGLENAAAYLEEHHEELQVHFTSFFPLLQQGAGDELARLLTIEV